MTEKDESILGSDDADATKVGTNHIDAFADFEDEDEDDGTSVFTVLLKDGNTINVRGHRLGYELHSLAGQDVYSIIHTLDEDEDVEIIVALFKSGDVNGIYLNDLHSETVF